MSIKTLSDWGAVELAAQNHELKQVETPKVPLPTQAQQLLWASQRCAELQAKVHRMQGKANEALLWLSMGDGDRAKQAISQAILDL